MYYQASCLGNRRGASITAAGGGKNDRLVIDCGGLGCGRARRRRRLQAGVRRLILQRVSGRWAMRHTLESKHVRDTDHIAEGGLKASRVSARVPAGADRGTSAEQTLLAHLQNLLL